MKKWIYLVKFYLLIVFQGVLPQTCDPCKTVNGDPYLYVLTGTDSVCSSVSASSDGCVYRYEGNDELYCYDAVGIQSIGTCTEPKEYFIVAAGNTGENSDLSSALVYDSDWGITNLPDLPISGGSVIGGITGDKILMCNPPLSCYSWSKSSPASWNMETSPPTYSLPTAVTTFQGVWFSGGIPSFRRKKRDTENEETYEDRKWDTEIDFAQLQAQYAQIEDDINNAPKVAADAGLGSTASVQRGTSLNPFQWTYLVKIDETTGVSTTTRAVPDFTEARFYHCAIENGDNPIVTGGISLAQVYFDLVEQYDLNTGEVIQLPSLNVARTNHGCTRFRQNPTQNEWTMVVAGGWLNAQYTSKVEILHPGATEWILAPDLPAYRLFTTMQTMDDVAYLIGGGEVVEPSVTWQYQSSIMLYNASLGTMLDTGYHINPTRKSMAVFSVPRQVMP